MALSSRLPARLHRARLVPFSAVLALALLGLLYASLDLPAPPSAPSFAGQTWVDPKLFDTAEELAFARGCDVGQSVLDHLPFYAELMASAPLAPTPDGIVRFSPPTEPRNASDRPDDADWHPVLRLMAQAERSFRAFVEGQSRTLAEAELAYRRRWKRPPPPGFEHWWAFAEANDVLFPDSHLATSLLEPFHAMTADERKRRLGRAATSVDDADVGPGGGGARQSLVVLENDADGLRWSPLAPSNSSTPAADPPVHKRTRAHLALLAPIQHLLPPFRAILNNADQPVVLLEPKHPGELEDAEQKPSHKTDWRALCTRRTPGFGRLADAARDRASRLGPSSVGEEVGFVQDVGRASDPCLNPQLLSDHGFYLQQTPAAPNGLPLTHAQLLPILSLSSTPLHADVPIPAVGIEGTLDRPSAGEPAWVVKHDGIYWRGSATGMQNAFVDGERVWERAHRPRLSAFANAPDGGAQALEVDPQTGGARWAADGGWRRRWVDVHLAASVFWRWLSWWPEKGQQCDYLDGSCAALAGGFSYVGKDKASAGEQSKIVLDVDGNGWSARFPRLMASQSLVVKATAFTEWNGPDFPAWIGYAPANHDYSDLHSLLAFFQQREGADAGSGQFDELGRRMAEAGRCWKARTGRVVDMQAYMLRTYLEIARLFNEGDGGEAAAKSARAAV